MAEYARERRIFVPINVIPKLVIARLPVGRGQALLRARRPRLHRHRPRRLQATCRTGASERARRRLHHHPAGGQELPAVERAHARPQAQGGDPRHPHRARLLQGQDPRALSQRDLSRHRLLRRRRRRAQLFQQGAERAHASRRRPISRRCPRRPTTIIRSAGPRKPPIRRDWIIDQMAENGYITAEQAKAAKAKPLKVNIRPFGTQIYAADYFAEEVRRTPGRDVRRGRPLRPRRAHGRRRRPRQRRPVGPHHARPQSAAHGAPGADRRPGRFRPRARAGAGPCRSIDDRRRLGRAARRHRDSDRPAALAPRRRARGADAPRPSSACARRASPTAASPPSARRSRSPSTR